MTRIPGRDSIEQSRTSRIAASVRRRVEIDARALAAFRIALGALLIVDLVLRSRNLVAFYTDQGVLPRAALFSDYGDVYSLHAVWGEAWIQAGLFLVAGAFGLALLVGYRTRVATIVSWLLLASLHARNPMVLNGGDVLFRMLLFWGMFLPLGKRWSLDAARADAARSPVASIATAALLLQVVLLYVTNAAHKLGGVQWLNGEAIIYVFSLDQFTVLLGNVLAEYYGLLRVFTYVWITLVVLSPLLLVLTGRARAVLATALAGMHLGMLATMQLGLFPLIVVAGLLPFYPSPVWNSIENSATRLGLTRWLDGVSERLQRQRVSVPPLPTRLGRRSWNTTALAHARQYAVGAVALCFVVLVVVSNAQAIGVGEVPADAEPVLEVTQTEQHWRMFAPDPLSTDGWFVVPGNLTNGTTVDVFADSRVDWDRPPSIDAEYPTARWRKYLRNVWSSNNRDHRSYFSHYLCGRWNRSHETDVESIGLYYMAQHSAPYNETEPIERHHLHDHDCGGGLAQ